MHKECSSCQNSFEIRPEDVAQIDSFSPVINGKKYSLPLPTLCSLCRHRRRIAWRNERQLFRRSCAISGTAIISAFPPSSTLKVCKRAEWLALDNTQFAREIDFTRPFFPQFIELYRDTFKANVIQGGEMINSEYTHFTGWLKDCYLLFDSGKSEDCMYGALVGHSKNCLDGHSVLRSELCYQGFRLENCYSVADSSFCKSCNFSDFLSDCIGCRNCLGCVNLRNREYHVLNEAVGKEGYLKARAEFISGSYRAREAFRAKFQALRAAVPRRQSYMLNTTGSTGDNLSSCENMHECYDAAECKDCSYCYDLFFGSNDCADISAFGESMQFCYELSGCGGYIEKTGISNCLFSIYIFYGGYNVRYSISCHEQCKELFGCTDLRRKEFCILNQQYSAAEYDKRIGRLVEHMQATGEWGQFFPIADSPFGYNESLAAEDSPLSREEAMQLGFNWSEYTSPAPDVASVILAADLPDAVQETTDDILTTAIVCAATGKPFRIMPNELQFYRRQSLPLPRFHPEERQRRRAALKRRSGIYERQCSNCGAAVKTAYRPEETFTMYCERCYMATVY